MKKITGKIIAVVVAIFFVMLFTGIVPMDVSAREVRTVRKVQQKIGKTYFGKNLQVVEDAPESGQADAYLEDMTGMMDFSDLDDFLEEGEAEITFSGIVDGFLQDGISKESLNHVVEWIKEALFGEIQKNQRLLLEIVLLAFCFSILKNFAGVFESAYIADLCFILVYCVLALMLLTSFQAFQQVAEGALQKGVDFMKALVPTFCISMVFSSNVSSSVGFYQLAFFVIYLVEWLFLHLLLPMVHIYVILEVFNHFMLEERLSNLTELFRDIIQWGMKTATVAVMGLNVVQGLIGPAKDRLAQGTFAKATAVVPGIGGVVNGVGEMLLGAGIVLKSCIGAAGLVVLVLIGVVPFVKVGCLTFFYKLAAAVTEPVTDKRICGCLKGMSEGALLYMKLVGYGMMLFFLTISLTTASTGYIY